MERMLALVRRYRWIMGGLLAGALFYVFDAFIDPLVSGSGAFVEELLDPSPVEIWIRSFIFVLFLAFSTLVQRVIDERDAYSAEREDLILALQDALHHIKVLRGTVPICPSCKRIRDEEGRWNLPEAYLSSHTEARFASGLCPNCDAKDTDKLAPVTTH